MLGLQPCKSSLWCLSKGDPFCEELPQQLFFFPNPCQLLGIYHVLWLTCLCFFLTQRVTCAGEWACAASFFLYSPIQTLQSVREWNTSVREWNERACVQRPFVMCGTYEWTFVPWQAGSGNNQDLVKWNLSCPAMHIIWTTCNHDSKTLP